MPTSEYKKRLQAGWNVGIDRHEHEDNPRKTSFRQNWRQHLKEKRKQYNSGN